jgi:hypothetical protein
MTGKDEILNELKANSPGLENASRQMPFSLPDGYFNAFPENMLLKVAPAPVREVPEGYFDNFATQMLQKVRTLSVQDELESIAPNLNTIGKTMPFSLPEGYFETWEPALPKVQQVPAKVVQMRTNVWKPWAVAASIVATLGIGWLLWTNNDQPPADNEVYSSQNDTSVDILLNNLDANTLAGYLENTETISELETLMLLAQENIETGVKQVSTDELKWYLENEAIPGNGT